jgi:hypothetical protein
MSESEQFRQDMIQWLKSQDRAGGVNLETAQRLNPITVPEGISIAVSRAKDEIVDDVRRGRVPQSCRSFSELHDYVDANYYGAAFDWPCFASDRDDTYQTAFTDFWNTVQGNVDQWIKAGGLKQRGQGNGRV